MAKTQSELLWEKFCSELKINSVPIQVGNGKTPDYKLTINEQIIIVEVKQIERNEEDRESDRLLNERGAGNVLSEIPGHRVRAKIKASSRQIKSRTKGRYPSILILFDQVNQGRAIGHLEPYHIRVAMCGLDQYQIAVPKDITKSPYITGKSSGPKRQMTETSNTSISAIGVLLAPSADEIKLLIYHNKFATVPLNYSLFSKYQINQYVLGGATHGNIPDWKNVSI